MMMVLSLWNKTNHCPDCFDKGCAFVPERLNHYSRIVPEHYSNYNQYYGGRNNANPFDTRQSVVSFHECKHYCKGRLEPPGSQIATCRQYFEENHWIPTLELEKVPKL